MRIYSLQRREMARKDETLIVERSREATYHENLQREKNQLVLQVSDLQQENTSLLRQVNSLRKLETLSKLTGIFNLREIRGNEDLMRSVTIIVSSSLADLLPSEENQ